MYFLHPHFSYLTEKIPETKIVRFEKFSDGWPRIFLEEKENISGKEITYIGDFRYVDDFFGQIAFLDGIGRYAPSRIDIIVPFFPAASMERDTSSGELSIAHVFARMLGLIGDRHPGRVHIHLYDIHDEREIFYFPPSLQIHHHTTTDILKTSVLKNSPIILFPDAGAKKAFSRFFTNYEVVTCAKVRKSPTEIEMYFEGGNLDGREVFIIDDHIRSGGTLVEACRYARAKGASSVSAFVPHSVFAEGVKESFLSAFDGFYTTDTIPENIERFSGMEKVKVLPFLNY
ncbi:ribose-phosphate diphosphokinase [Candidatus Gracilibacteria bacterium]|nr:ribose-phosphate diphosphokinase [Candidatus Gracilibacteria bacterium]